MGASAGWASRYASEEEKQRAEFGLMGVALLAIIGLTVVLTITVTKNDKGDGSPAGTAAAPGTSSPQAPASDIASANDTGPATIITEEPTCAAWIPISNSIADVTEKAHWTGHDDKVPAAEWTPELRAMYETVGKEFASDATQAVTLSKSTPHRVVRELYQQFIAYAHAFSDSLPSYVAEDNYLVNVAINASVAIQAICDSINFQSAQARAPFVSDPSGPLMRSKVGDVNNPEQFMSTPHQDCAKWIEIVDRFNSDSQAWGALDPGVQQADWDSDQRAIIDAVKPIMVKYADDIEQLGRNSSAPVVEDFAVLSAQYWRAYVAALPTYSRADYYLSRAAARPVAVIYQACRVFGF